MNKIKKIVQVVHEGDYRNTRYSFEMPINEELKPGDIVCVQTKGNGKQVARCVTRGLTLNDELIDMMMCGKKVTGKVLGKYDYREYGDEEEV